MRNKYIVLLGISLALANSLFCCSGGGGGGSGQTMPPAAVRALAGDAPMVVVGWNASVGATSYNLYMATVSGVTRSNYSTLPGGMKLTGVNSPYTITGLAINTTYYAVVTAVNAAGESGESLEVQGTPTAGPGDTNNYFPVTAGNTWNFSGTETISTGPTTTYTNVITAGTSTLNGVLATTYSQTNSENLGPVVDYLLKDSNGIISLGNNDATDLITQQMVPYWTFKFPLSGSFVITNLFGLDSGIDLDGDGINETVDINTTVSIISTSETVTVPVGSFLNALHIDQNSTLTFHLSTNGALVTAHELQSSWFAPNVGPIQSIDSVILSGITTITTEQLIGYYVDGQGKGILSQFTVASGVANPDDDITMPGKPAISFDGTNYLVIFRMNSGSTSGIYGVTISGSGTGNILNTFPIVQLPPASQFTDPAIAYDGTNYLIAFQLYGQIFGTRVSPSGNVLDGPSGFAISSGTPNVITNFSPAITFDGTNYLVVWAKFIGGYDIYGARITTAGQSLGEFPISQAAGEQVDPSVAFDGINYMVVWRDTRTGSGPTVNTHIYGTRVTTGGTVLDPAGIPVSTAPGPQEEPQIIFDGTNYFVVWEDQRNGISAIYGTRMKPDGTLLDGPSATGGIAINASSNGDGFPSVIFDGTNYFVVWTIGSFSNYPPAGIFAARVSTNGGLIDGPPTGTGISISGLPPSSSLYVYPTILFNGQNSLLTWLNNSELAGATKDIDGIVIYPY
jgi:hypothetical protein